MATWTSRATLGSTNIPVNVTSSGTKIYWGDRIGSSNAAGDVYEYNPTGHVVTRIIELAAITNLDAVVGLCWFNGELYLYNSYTTGTPFEKSFKVEKWTGVTNGLTTVDTVATHLGGSGARLYTVSGALVATFIVRQVDTGSTCRYSSNGSGWSTATFSIEPHHASGGDVAPFPYASHHPLSIHEALCTSNTIGACTTFSTFIFNGSAWTVVSTDALKYYQGIISTSKYFTRTGDDNYTTDFVSNTNTTGSAVKIFQINMPWHPGVIDTGSATELYEFDGNTTWVLLETIATYQFGDSNATMVRLADGEVFLIGFDTSLSSYRIIQRDTPITTGLTTFDFTRSAGGVPGAVAI